MAFEAWFLYSCHFCLRLWLQEASVLGFQSSSLVLPVLSALCACVSL